MYDANDLCCRMAQVTCSAEWHKWYVLQMTYIQATQGGGGWPMSCFLTPDLKPFLGGTYFPPQDAYGRPGFKTLLRRITEVWHKKKDDIKLQSADSMQQLVDMSASQGYSSSPSCTYISASLTLTKS